MMKTGAQANRVGRVPRPAPDAYVRLSRQCVSHLTRQPVFSQSRARKLADTRWSRSEQARLGPKATTTSDLLTSAPPPRG
jgi:hypothetical protein